MDTPFRAVIEATRRHRREPPSSEDLLAYQRGELSAEDEARIQELLAHHPEAVRHLLDLAACTEEPGDPGYLSDEELDRDWSEVRRRLHQQEIQRLLNEEEERAGKVLPFNPVPAPQEIRTWQTAAVAALVLVAASIVWISNLWQDVGELSQTLQELGEPRPNVERHVLLPDGHRRGPEGPRPVQLPPEASEYLLILSVIDARRFADYRLEIVDSSEPDAEPLWSRGGFRRRGDDTFELWLRRDFFPPGEYRLRLFGVDEGDGAILLAQYDVRLGEL